VSAILLSRFHDRDSPERTDHGRQRRKSALALSEGGPSGEDSGSDGDVKHGWWRNVEWVGEGRVVVDAVVYLRKEDCGLR
jgi:hypothetical protein